MGFMVAVDTSTLLYDRSVKKAFSLRKYVAKECCQKLVLNYLAVMILGCIIVGSPGKLKSEPKKSCLCGQTLQLYFF